MTLKLPRSNVEVNARRRGPARLTAPERQALAKVEDPALRKALGEIFIAQRGTQQNLDEIAQQFPIQPENAAAAVLGPITTKGDVIAGDEAGEADRLAVGANDLVLTADSAKPLGVRWGEVPEALEGVAPPFELNRNAFPAPGADEIKIPVDNPGTHTFIFIYSLRLPGQATPSSELKWKYGEDEGSSVTGRLIAGGGKSGSGSVGLYSLDSSREKYPTAATTLTLIPETEAQKLGKRVVVVATLNGTTQSNSGAGASITTTEYSFTYGAVKPAGSALAVGISVTDFDIAPTVSNSQAYATTLSGFHVGESGSGKRTLSLQFAIANAAATTFTWAHNTAVNPAFQNGELVVGFCNL